MAQRRDGSPATLEELRAYADYLEKQIFRMNKQVAESTNKEGSTAGDIRLLNLQQDRIMDDIRSINQSLKDLTFSIGQIGILAQKQEDTANAMARAHKRIDAIEAEYKDHRDKQEEKLQKLEIHQAKGAWLERLVMAVVLGIVTLWAKGG